MIDRANVPRLLPSPLASATAPPRLVGVIGAGLAGLVCARALADAGASVIVFDKGQVPGGRMSQRLERGLRFDHGAQYFTARGDAFRRAVAGLRRQGVVARWPSRVAGSDAPRDDHARYVGAPGMNAFALALAASLDVRRGTRIDHVEPRGARFRLRDDAGATHADVDAVVVATPAPQAAPLLAAAPALAEEARAVTMLPCWAMMLALDAPADARFEAARLSGAPLAWVANDGTKPHRDANGAERWVAHATASWSAAHLEDTSAAVADALLAPLADTIGAPRAKVRFVHAHRWRFAKTDRPAGRACLGDDARRIVACGDWCLGARVESAFASGLAAAHHLLALPPPDLAGAT